MTRDIRATRDRLGLTTAELARLVGVKNRTAHHWLAGTQDVPESVWRLLELFCDVAQIDADCSGWTIEKSARVTAEIRRWLDPAVSPGV